MNSNLNIRLILINEISLEGLDGITLQALWIRISEVTKIKLPFSERVKADYWSMICKIPDFTFFELEAPRADLVIYDRFVHFDNETESYYEPDEPQQDIYEYKPVLHELSKIRGSCASFFSRKDVTDDARATSYEEIVERYGSKLVIVASQESRDYALINSQTCQNVDITTVQYCLLERIGRSRFHGEITQGKRSLQILGEDPKTLFYHRKALLKHKLITKQIYHQKCGSQNYSGTLLHLQRYFVEKKPKPLIVTEMVVEFLKTRPNYRSLYPDVLAALHIAANMKKVFKGTEFQRFVRTDFKIPYREYYPNADISEWKHKHCDKERTVRIMELIDPDVEVAEHWNSLEDPVEEDEGSGYQNYENLSYGVALLGQAAKIVCGYGVNGLCQSQIGEIMGQNKLSSRSLCRNLLRLNAVTCVMDDVGRQRVTRFVSRKFENKGQMNIQFKQERERMMSLITTTDSKSDIDLVETKDETNLSESLIGDESNLTEKYEPIDNLIKTSDEESLNSSFAESEPLKKKLKTGPDLTPKKRRLSEDSPQLEAKKQKIDPIKQNRIQSADLDNIDVKLIVAKTLPGIKGYSQGFTEQLKQEGLNPSTKDGGKVTYRLLRRANFIIECVRQEKVIADLTKLIKMIQEDEHEEGYHAKIDKKSMIRLLLKLAKDGYVKYIRATLTSGSKVKQICFVCDPNIDENHSVIQSALEQAKMKFYISIPRVTKPRSKLPDEEKIDDTFNTEEIKDIRKEIHKFSTMDNVEYPYDRKATMRYGFSPKFIRMRLVHEFLFYLTYEKPDALITQPKELHDCLVKLGQSPDEKLINEMSTIYYDKELNWRMFIPPIPTHAGWPTGWSLICDVLLRLPLSIFVQCFHVPYQIEDLYPYLNHPIRKHFLVRHLPAKIRNALMHKRRYIYAMHEIVSRLCFIGLVQFGPQRLKEKDQVFIFLNRKTSLLNTVTSQPGYHEISNIEYEKHMYYFENSHDIDHYWYELWTTCINTTLGGRLCVTGKYIVLEQLHTKQSMLDAVLPRLPHEAAEKDTGDVPGDKKGAAGFDSAIFAHLKRNWKWLRGMNIIGAANPHLKPEATTVKIHTPTTNKTTEMAIKKHIIAAGNKASNKTKKINVTPPPKAEPRVKRFRMLKKPIVRKVLASRTTRKPFYDDKDKEALLKMNKLRTGWSPIEDHVLLLCTVGTQYLCPNRRRQMVAVAVIRDALHSLVQTANCKTSRACQRRIVYIMKNTNTRRSVNMCLEEIRQNATIAEKYVDIVKRSHTGYVGEQELNIAFLELVAFMSKMFVNMIQPEENAKYCLPASITELKENYHIYATNKKSQTSNKELQNSHDIEFHVIRTVIHSSMSCTKDKTSWAYQLFKVYQQYPESLLRSVITKTRLEQMISLKKSYVKSHKSGSSIPLSSSPYQLSISYRYQLLSKYPYTLFEETYDMLQSFTNWLNHKGETNVSGFEIKNALSGTVTALMEMTQKLSITFKFDIPEDVITLDQQVQNDTTYERILKRFYNILHDPTSFNKWEEKQRIENPDDDEENFPDLDLDEMQKKPSENIPNFKSQTRIAFYMMRAEMCEGLDDKSKQHLHDFFVVNGSKVFLNIPSSVQIPENCGINEIGNSLMFIKADVGKEIINRIKRNSILPKECPSELEVLESLSNINANKSDIDLAQRIILHCLSSDIFGATIQEINALVPESYEGIMPLFDLLDVLIDIKIIIQSGIAKYRYIHYKHKKPWVINTYKIMRLDREKLPTIMTSSKEPMSDKLIRLKKHFSSIELHKSKQRLDLTSQQEITVLLTPWLRIDGSLNRRVLDRWLGAILTACIEQPGINLEALSNKFHYMKPVDVITLIKFLGKLECISQIFVLKPKTSLISSIPSMTIIPATGIEDSKDILVEPQCNAVSKLALFIGEKNYSTGFFV